MTTLSCETPSETGKLAGLNLRGTYSGAKRHERLKEPKCEQCRLAYNKAKRDQRAANPERDRKRVREYWTKNPEKRRLNVARFRENNPEAWNRIKKASAKRNAEKIRISVKARKKRLRDATPYKVSPQSVVARIDYWGRKCWMCGGPYEHIDHVKPIAAGGLHIPANMRPSCAPCNIRKRDKWPFKESAA
jgi:5-methylcytosine-specific restriction endonuclease McrA